MPEQYSTAPARLGMTNARIRMQESRAVAAGPWRVGNLGDACRWLAHLALVTAMAVAQGCASVPERNPLPEITGDLAPLPGYPEGSRLWGDDMPEYGARQLRTLSDAEARAQRPAIVGRPHTYLAISGGGANGAFGAGLLNGWTAAGNRPEFTMVTGISTGALTAPFAFLGPTYDATLKAMYTTVSTKDLVRERGFLEIATGDSAVDVSPLKQQLAKYVTEDVMRAIASEHARGRRLWIGTTHMDAARPVIWDIGRIAGSGHPQALELIREIMLASASIPGVFPPVYFEVEYDGERYDEMHADGGTAQQVFVYPSAIDWPQVLKKLDVPPGTSRVYVLRNAFLDPEWTPVEPTLLAIAGRSIESLIRTQGMGDLHLIYLLSRRDGLDYNLAHIPDDFDQQPREPFDPDYMQALFNLGYDMARNGYPWEKKPPRFAGIHQAPEGALP